MSLKADKDDRQPVRDAENPVRNLKLILAYDGTDFAGWQVQPGRATIQGTLASAIGRLTRENVLPQGSGRTDAGVHALAQVAGFQSGSTIPTENWVPALNHILPPSIRVLRVTEAAPDFHPRKSVRSKTYRYRIHRAAICPPFAARYVWHYPYPLDEAAMIAAAEVVIGEHDFTSFAAVDPERVERMTADLDNSALERAAGTESTLVASTNVSVGVPTPFSPTNVRKISSSTWQRDADELIFTVRGNGFLHHMVRNLVGTFILVGKGTITREDLDRILAARNRSVAGPTAPASGLFLVNVEY
ncbi:MAG: tRNA pseudouridine synthase A [Terriglobales bacterium]